MNIFQRIVQWNKDRNNLGFSHFNETKMLAEELFEFCGFTRQESKNESYEFAIDTSIGEEGVLDFTDSEFIEYIHDSINENVYAKIDKPALVDALGDLVFIAIGGITKLGYDPEEVMKRICDANDKKGSKKDSSGKIIKDETFVEPVHG